MERKEGRTLELGETEELSCEALGSFLKAPALQGQLSSP